MNKITYLSLYILNRVRLQRLILGISSRVLSELLEHSIGYVGMIESSATKGQYPPHEWPTLAKALNCRVHDLLPSDDMDQKSTGLFVDKIVLSLNIEADVKLVVSGLIEYNYFGSGKTIDETAKHLFIDESSQLMLLEKVLNELVEQGKLTVKEGVYAIGTYK